MDKNLQQIREYVFKKNENYKEQNQDLNLSIYQDEDTLSFTIKSFTLIITVGLQLFLKSYIENTYTEVTFNGYILNDEQKRLLFEDLQKQQPI